MQFPKFNRSRRVLHVGLLVFAAYFFTSCSGTNGLTMTVTEPAPVELSADMKRIGTINRSGTDVEPNAWDKLDKVLSAEGKNLDKDGAEQAMAGLDDRLHANNRFDLVVSIDADQVVNKEFAVFPAPMSWEEVAKVCKEHDLDGLFVLEFYDTDSKVDYATHPVTIKGPLGVNVPAVEHEATVQTIIKTGWRIYDLNNQRIVDEFIVSEGVTNRGRGINPMKAVEAIRGRKSTVNNISRNIGEGYAASIQPYNIRVHRDYFVKGSNEFKIGKRKAQTGNWDGAAEHWYVETENPSPKVAGRAYYNMAIINEINGDVDTAIDWASQSYETYGNRQALEYVRILRNRKAKLQVLERQEFAAQ